MFNNTCFEKRCRLTKGKSKIPVLKVILNKINLMFLFYLSVCMHLSSDTYLLMLS